jgi:small neutral amino acid transporter SnatA (MarC family)
MLAAQRLMMLLGDGQVLVVQRLMMMLQSEGPMLAVQCLVKLEETWWLELAEDSV